jgi:hypothetical protein
VSSFALQSILVEDGRFQVSYIDPDSRSPHGVEVHTPVIILSPALDAEMAELTDAALQLVTAWGGLMRESPGP